MPRPRRRTLLLALLCLLTGATVTIAIAWRITFRQALDVLDGGTRWESIRRPDGVSTSPRIITITTDIGTGWSVWSVSYYTTDADDTRLAGTRGLAAQAPAWIQPRMAAYLPRPGEWLDIPPSPTTGLLAIEALTCWSAGWPLECMREVVRIELPAMQPFRWTVDGGWHTPWRSSVRTIPLFLPLWIAPLPFIANTLIFAVPIFLACVAFGHARVRRRMRRGQCRRCTYDLSATARGLPCPECGAKSPSPADLQPTPDA